MSAMDSPYALERQQSGSDLLVAGHYPHLRGLRHSPAGLAEVFSYLKSLLSSVVLIHHVDYSGIDLVFGSSLTNNDIIGLEILDMPLDSIGYDVIEHDYQSDQWIDPIIFLLIFSIPEYIVFLVFSIPE